MQVYLTLVQLLLLSSPSEDSSECSPFSQGMIASSVCSVCFAVRADVSDDSHRHELAISLLNRHPQKVDPIQALLLLPPGTGIAKLRHFLEMVTKHTQKERKSGQIFRNLLRSQHLQTQGQRIRIQQSHKIIIEDNDLCRSCQKRIGKTYVLIFTLIAVCPNHMHCTILVHRAFLRYPNGHLVHYYCKDSYNARSA